MSNESNLVSEFNSEIIESTTSDLFNIFSVNPDFMTRDEIKTVVNIISESLFNEKIKNKNFNIMFDLLATSHNNNQVVMKKNFEPIAIAFIICFNVNCITNTDSFNDKICIKVGKHTLPISYYIKKN